MKRRSVTIVAIGLALLTWWKWERLAYYKFDSETWSSADSKHRYYMARYLVEKGEIQKWTRKEVLEKLGTPKRGDPSGSSFRYELGSERGLFPMDGEVLVIQFDENGRVKMARIHPT